jgi:heme exporter protein D
MESLLPCERATAENEHLHIFYITSSSFINHPALEFSSERTSLGGFQSGLCCRMKGFVHSDQRTTGVVSMRTSRIWITVIVTVVVLALLAAGGYALFRLGYARGVANAAGGLMLRGPEGRFGGEGLRPFAHEMMPGWNHPGLNVYGMHTRTVGYHPAFGWFLGLLLVAGVVALVVIAINGLSQRTRIVAEESKSPAQAEEKPSRRRAKKNE